MQSKRLSVERIYAICLLIIALGLSSCSSEANYEIRIDGSNGVKPLVMELAEAYQNKFPSHSLLVGEGMSSSKRLSALDTDSVQIVMASHGLDILRLEIDDYQVFPFAKMPVVIGASTGVSLDSMDGSTLCSIYSGNVRNWKELGGGDKPIRAFLRPIDEVDSEVLLEKVPCMRVIAIDTSVKIMETSGDMAEALSSTTGSLGITTLTRVNQSSGKIKALIFNEAEPTLENMENGSYTLLRDAFLVSSPEMSETVNRFFSFIDSKRGASVLRKNGALPIPRN